MTPLPGITDALSAEDGSEQGSPYTATSPTPTQVDLRAISTPAADVDPNRQTHDSVKEICYRLRDL